MDAKPWTRQPPDGTPMQWPWREISNRAQHGGITVLGSIGREPTVEGLAYTGNGSTKGLYISLVQGVTCASSGGSIAIMAIFLGSTATSGMLVSLGVSANSLGGYFYIARNTGGTLSLGIDDAANASGLISTTSTTYNEKQINCAVGLLTTDGAGARSQKLFVNGKLEASGVTAGFNLTTYDRAGVGVLRRQSTSGFASDKILTAAFSRNPLGEQACMELSAMRWSKLFPPRLNWRAMAEPATGGVSGPLIGGRLINRSPLTAGRLVA